MATTYTAHFNLPIMDGDDNINVAPINQGMTTLDGVLYNQESMTKMKKISCTSLQDLKDKLTTLMASVPVEYAIELVLVTTQFDIFGSGTHSFTFHKLANTYFWGYGFVQNKMAIIASENGTWKTGKYGAVLQNVVTADHHLFLEQNDGLYHMHYERFTKIANGGQAGSIASQYAPLSNSAGSCVIDQTSGMGLAQCIVDTSGNIYLYGAYNQPVYGVFDVYWEK